MIGYVTTGHEDGPPFFEEPNVLVEPQSPDPKSARPQR